jgi:hypothetical protein
MDVAVDQAGNQAPALEVDGVHRQCRGQRRQLAPDPQDPAAAQQQLLHAQRFRRVHVGIAEQGQAHRGSLRMPGDGVKRWRQAVG